MLTIGIDVHMRYSVVCILSERGEQIKTCRVDGGPSELCAFLRGLEGRKRVCFEASCGYGVYHDALRRVADRVVVAHPGRLRLIFRSSRKHDRIDAQRLATLLFLEQVPPVHVPGADARAWRELVELRSRTINKRVRAKNGLRALLRSQAIRCPHSLWTRKGLAWLESLDLPSRAARLRRDVLIEELAHFERIIARITAELDRMGRAHPGVTLLQTIPGVGPRTAEAVCAYIDRPDRFGARRVGAYFGLVPRQDQSGSMNHLGHITREGPGTVRRLLAEAAWQCIRRDAGMRSYFERVMRNDPERRKIALVATAHRLVRAMHAMLQTGEAWREEAAMA